mmetsp:Transcript_7625/g.12158  ORF Transcript_7625/g.12158 Transcript_7625/m.12158 type:complete len:208 (+) Transcript_7625:705-1328(+)
MSRSASGLASLMNSHLTYFRPFSSNGNSVPLCLALDDPPLSDVDGARTAKVTCSPLVSSPFSSTPASFMFSSSFSCSPSPSPPDFFVFGGLPAFFVLPSFDVPCNDFRFLADPSVNDFRFMADSFLADPCNDFLFLVDPSFSSADPCTDFRFLVDALLGVFCDDLRANCLLLALPLPFLDEISLGEHAGDKRGGGLTSAEEASLGVE